MQATTLLSVMSSAVVVAALSSAYVQSTPTQVVVAAGAPVAEVVADPAPPAQPVVDAAHPAYVQLPHRAAAVSLRATPGAGGAAGVDVLACTTAWSPTGECRGRQVEVLRDVRVELAVDVVPVPAEVPHLRVSVSDGSLDVQLSAS